MTAAAEKTPDVRTIEDVPVEFRAACEPFLKAARHASHHYADDSAKEWGQGDRKLAEAQAIYDAADDASREWMLRLSRHQLGRIKTHMEPTKDLIGRQVVYRGSHPNAKAEQGEVTSVNYAYVFVRFNGTTPQACTPTDLSHLSGEPVVLPRVRPSQAA